MTTFEDVENGRKFEWVKSGEVSRKVGFDIFYDPTEDELFRISGSNLYSPKEEVKLIDSCLDCKNCDKQADHMYKYDGWVGAERWEYYCEELETYIGVTSLGDCIEADPKTFTCEKFDAKLE